MGRDSYQPVISSGKGDLKYFFPWEKTILMKNIGTQNGLTKQIRIKR